MVGPGARWIPGLVLLVLACPARAGADSCGVLEMRAEVEDLSPGIASDITAAVAAQAATQGEFEEVVRYDNGEFDASCPGDLECLGRFAAEKGHETLIVGTIGASGTAYRYKLILSIFRASLGDFERTVEGEVRTAPVRTRPSAVPSIALTRGRVESLQ